MASSRLRKCFTASPGDARSGSAKNDIECDRHSLQLVKPGEQIREHGPWPGPLPVGAHAFLVDIDNHNGTNGGVSRADVLIEIEATKPELLQRIRIPDTGWREGPPEEKGRNSAESQTHAPIAEACFSSRRPHGSSLGLTQVSYPSRGMSASIGREAASANRKPLSVLPSGQSIRPACREQACYCPGARAHPDGSKSEQ